MNLLSIAAIQYSLKVDERLNRVALVVDSGTGATLGSNKVADNITITGAANKTCLSKPHVFALQV